MVDICNEQYAWDDIDTEATQQAPKETPEETPKQSGAPADDRIDIPLAKEEITILTSGEEEGGTQQEEQEDQPRDQPRQVEVISIDPNEENAPVACKWGSFLPSNHTYIYIYFFFINIFAKYYVFFPVTSQTLENCSEEFRSVVSQILNGAAKTEPTTMTTTMPPVPATPSTSGAKPSPSTSGAKPFFDPVTMSAWQDPLPGKTLLLNLIWCLVFSAKTWWLVCSFVASFLELPAFAKDMIRNVIDKVWSDGVGLAPLILPPYPSQYCFPSWKQIRTNLKSDSSNRSGNYACICTSFFIAVVEFVHESEALNVVSGAGDTVLIGKAYMTYMTE